MSTCCCPTCAPHACALPPRPAASAPPSRHPPPPCRQTGLMLPPAAAPTWPTQTGCLLLGLRCRCRCRRRGCRQPLGQRCAAAWCAERPAPGLDAGRIAAARRANPTRPRSSCRPPPSLGRWVEGWAAGERATGSSGRLLTHSGHVCKSGCEGQQEVRRRAPRMLWAAARQPRGARSAGKWVS